jgi:oxygen-independent coproporphyrinogen-3 oxidase
VPEVTRLPILDQTPPNTSRSARFPLEQAAAAARHAQGNRPWPGATSLYIHVPFCFHKCHYCDFYSIVDTRDRQEPFVERLIAELVALAPFAARPIETIFVGGGTPSLLRPDLWRRLLKAIDERFDLSRLRAASGLDRARLSPDAGEFTVECNPETVTRELMDTLREGGVTRVSMGAQSFNPAHLKTLERWHDPASVPRAMELAREAGLARRSIDLIFAIPGQTLGEWESDLAEALSLGTEHLSCYALTYEPNTAMTARLRRGEVRPAPEDLEAEMFEATIRVLRRAGLERYEVSNFARPGAECRHNLAYWRQRDWLAAGPSASAHVQGHRWKNVTRLDDYLASSFTNGGSDAGFSWITEHETPDPRRSVCERILTGLRLAEGLSAAELDASVAALGEEAATRVHRALARQRSMGALRDLATDEGSRLVLTDQGFLVADAVVLALAEAVDP